MKHLIFPFLLAVLVACGSSGGSSGEDGDDGDDGGEEEGEETARSDGATLVEISSSGSHQNAAWSPDGLSLLFTRWRSGYNAEPADLMIVTLADGSVRTLVSDGSANVNLPGSAWNGTTGEIAFASSRDPHDEVYVISENGSPGDETKVTERDGLMVFEVSLSPDAQTVVFESHVLDVEGNGIIMTYRRDGAGGYVSLTDAGDDCRQPVWSPAGDKIVFQCQTSGQWDVWTMNTDGTGKTNLTNNPAVEETDPSFSPDGQFVVYSSDEGGLDFANLFVISVDGGESTRVTSFDGYDGAPSWSPDGSQIVFESFPGDPDDSSGTTLWIIDAPEM